MAGASLSEFLVDRFACLRRNISSIHRRIYTSPYRHHLFVSAYRLLPFSSTLYFSLAHHPRQFSSSTFTYIPISCLHCDRRPHGLALFTLNLSQRVGKMQNVRGNTKYKIALYQCQYTRGILYIYCHVCINLYITSFILSYSHAYTQIRFIVYQKLFVYIYIYININVCIYYVWINKCTKSGKKIFISFYFLFSLTIFCSRLCLAVPGLINWKRAFLSL